MVLACIGLGNVGKEGTRGLFQICLGLFVFKLDTIFILTLATLN